MTDAPEPYDIPLGRQIETLCRTFALAELYVFGSRAKEIGLRARGRTAPGQASASDVDVGVRPLPGLGPDALVELTGELERVLDAPRVDLVLLPTAQPFLALDVIRGELLYCADRDAQAEYELYVLRKGGRPRALPAIPAGAGALPVRGPMTPDLLSEKVVAERSEWVLASRVAKARQGERGGSPEVLPLRPLAWPAR